MVAVQVEMSLRGSLFLETMSRWWGESVMMPLVLRSLQNLMH
jgi:hypothetical protein